MPALHSSQERFVLALTDLEKPPPKLLSQQRSATTILVNPRRAQLDGAITCPSFQADSDAEHSRSRAVSE